MKLFFKIIVLSALISTAVCTTGCGSGGNPSVSSISESWLEIKTNIGAQIFGLADFDQAKNGKYETQIDDSAIDDFCDALSRFFATPLGALYLVHNPGEMKSLSIITDDAGKLKTAIHSGDMNTAFRLMTEIDRAIDLLQRIDTSLSERSQMHYFELFFFFTVLVISIILVLGILYSRLERAEQRELQSLEFSRETVMIQEQERERIARELHDTVLQDLWRLSFQTETIERTSGEEERSRLCREVASGQKEVMTRLRSLCDTLIPPDFRRRGLGGALLSLCHNFAQRTGIECKTLIQDTPPPETWPGAMDNYRQLQVYRIVQECLSNIEKHSGASEASLIMRSQEKGLLICVTDNGRGFSAPDRDSSLALRAQGHFGLFNMYERAAAIDGNLTLESSNDAGTMVTLLLPLQEAQP